MKKITKEKLAFEKSFKGFTIKVFYLVDKSGDALVEIFRDEKLFREFLYPAYKIWNLAAHFEEIVEGELKDSIEGYCIAGSDGLGGVVMPVPKPL